MTCEPVIIGPTWEHDPGHPSGWLFPKVTLGWAVLRWQAGRLQHADGRQWQYTLEQLRFICHWYALDDDLRFVWSDGVFQRLKGHGKDPLGATICATEFVGDCRPDPTGRTVPDLWGNEHPAGIPHPEAWVQTVAVSKDQTRNTMTLFPGLFTKRAIEEFDIDLGKELIYAHHGAKRLEAVTSSPRTLEGARSTFVLKNETHHWLENNEGHDMEAVIRRNVAKAADGDARSLAITNAYEPSEDSVAQRTREAWEKMQAGGALKMRLLYDSLEAPPDAPLTAEAVPEVVKAIRGDSVWLTPARVTEEVLDIRNPPSQSRRFWYNQITAVEDALLSMQEWDIKANAAFAAQPGDIVTLGLDPSLADDHTALVGCHVDADHVFLIDSFEPQKATGEIDRKAVDRAVRGAFEMYDVVGFYSDVRPLESYVDAWGEEFGEGLCVRSTPRQPVAWDMRGQARQRLFTDALARFVSAVLEPDSGFTHDGSQRLRWYVLNARRAPNPWGFSVRKEHRESDKKIDAVPAMVLARLARLDYLALPPSRRRRKQSSKVWGAW